jgi:hypothetical protein
LNARLRELEERQRRLLERSGRLRADIAAHGGEVAATFARVDQGFRLVRQFATGPALAATAGVLLLAAGPSRTLRVASRLIVVVTLVHRIGSLWSRLPRGPA